MHSETTPVIENRIFGQENIDEFFSLLCLGGKFKKCRFENMFFDNEDRIWKFKKNSFFDCTFVKCGFEKVFIRNCLFHACRFSACNFTCVPINECCFEKTVFEGTDMIEGEFYSVHFGKVDFVRTHIYNPRTLYVHFSECTIEHSSSIVTEGTELLEVTIADTAIQGIFQGVYHFGTRSDGYSFYLIYEKNDFAGEFPKIHAGCRGFYDFRSARKHWKSSRKRGNVLREQSLGFLKAMEHFHRKKVHKNMKMNEYGYTTPL